MNDTIASEQTAISALAAARARLRSSDCDPRDPNLFSGIKISLFDDKQMADLRDLICAVQSKRDRIPWSSNGSRISVTDEVTYLGTYHPYDNYCTAKSNLIDFFHLQDDVLVEANP